MQDPRGLCLQGGPQSRRRPWPGTLLPPVPAAWDPRAPWPLHGQRGGGSQYAGPCRPHPAAGPRRCSASGTGPQGLLLPVVSGPTGWGSCPVGGGRSTGARSPGALCEEPVGTVAAQCSKVSDTWSYVSFIILNQVSLSDRPEVLGTRDGPRYLHSPADTARYKDDDFSPQN